MTATAFALLGFAAGVFAIAIGSALLLLPDPRDDEADQ